MKLFAILCLAVFVVACTPSPKGDVSLVPGVDTVTSGSGGVSGSAGAAGFGGTIVVGGNGGFSGNGGVSATGGNGGGGFGASPSGIPTASVGAAQTRSVTGSNITYSPAAPESPAN